jgi:hypothetical protein
LSCHGTSVVAGKVKEAKETVKGKNTEVLDISGGYPGHTPAAQTIENNFCWSSLVVSASFLLERFYAGKWT